MFEIEEERKQKIIERNKKLIEEYPFLMPRNVFTDKIDPEYDYSYILGVDDLPKGWKKLFLQMCGQAFPQVGSSLRCSARKHIFECLLLRKLVPFLLLRVRRRVP